MTKAARYLTGALRRLPKQWCRVRSIDAVVQVTHYGAHIELSDGQACSMWQFALSEPATEAAIRWARDKGAVTIKIRR